MDTDLRNEQSDEAVSTSLEPKLWMVVAIHKTMLDPMLDALESFQHSKKCQPFHLVTIGDLTHVNYMDYEYPARDENMLLHCFELSALYAQAQDRHVKNLFHSPKQTNQTPEYGC